MFVYDSSSKITTTAIQVFSLIIAVCLWTATQYPSISCNIHKNTKRFRIYSYYNFTGNWEVITVLDIRSCHRIHLLRIFPLQFASWSLHSINPFEGNWKQHTYTQIKRNKQTGIKIRTSLINYYNINANNDTLSTLLYVKTVQSHFVPYQTDFSCLS